MNRTSNLIGDAWASKCSCHNGTDCQRVNPDLLLILFVIILLAIGTKDKKPGPGDIIKVRQIKIKNNYFNIVIKNADEDLIDAILNSF